jgi:4-amino-4-deoxy-L-arabinose transferase-like glycosyltransferase
VTRSALAVLALAFALAHAPFLAPSLEDIDSVNFALGVRDFDVADHRPHPPGYPMYIGFAKAAVAAAATVSGDAPQSTIEARGLSALALVGAIAAIVALYAMFRALAGSDVRALAATALTASSPLFWYLSVRPMSDVPGLAAALAAVACLALAWQRQRPDASGDRRLTPERMEASGRMIVLGALLTGIAVGFRSQNAMITLPFLVGVLLDRTGRGVAGAMLGGAVAMTLGALVWAVPLVVASGGVNAYLAALGSQAGQDFAGVDMLYLNPGNVRLAAFALLRTLIYPWDSLLLGGVVISCAALGVVALLVRDRRTLAAVLLLAVPYLAFHLLFHDTTFVRYALPLVPVAAFLAVTGLEFVARRAALPIVGALALWSVSIAAPTLVVYASEPSPTVRALGALGALGAQGALGVQGAPGASNASGAPGALAMHQTFRRPLQAENVEISPILPSPPRREWLELAKYWREGNTAPLWFLADPMRTDLALVDPKSRVDRTEFTWRWQSLNDLGGMRPRAVHWYQMPAPGWFAEEGWALTPETAGIARLMGRGPSRGPIQAWVRRRPEPIDVLVGGRHLGGADDPAVTFVMAIDGVDVAQWDSGPGFFLKQFALPAGVVAGHGLAPLTIRALSGKRGSSETAIEQFDLQSSGALMWGYDEGWHEAEYNPGVGMWRWMSERATLRIVNATAPVAVTLSVEPPQRYFDAPSTVRMHAGSRLLGETTFADAHVWRVVVPLEVLRESGGRVTLETNQTFVPADTSGVSDRRRLGVRVFGVAIAFEH